MQRIVASRVVADALVAEKLIPEHCQNVEIRLDAHGACTLHYDVLVTVRDTSALGRAFASIGDRLAPRAPQPPTV